MAAGSDAQHTNGRLQSWKEIATYFHRDERTIRRWEERRGLPVHRVPGGTRGAVYAYTDELEAWLRQPADIAPAAQSEPVEETPEPARPALRGNLLGRAVIAAAVLLLLAVPVMLLAWGPAHKVATPVAAAHRANPKAVALYRSGLYYWNARTPASLNLAVDAFTQAIVEDPDYAEAYVGLADCYNLLREYSVMPTDIAYPRAEAAARRAIALNPRLAHAHTSLAFVEFFWLRNTAAAEREFQQALALDPSSAQTHHWHASMLVTTGQYQEALAEIDKARALDPTSSAVLADRGLILFYAGREREAVDSLRAIEKAQPQFLSPHVYLAWMDLLMGDDAGHLDEMAASASLRHDKNGLAVADAARHGWELGGHTGMLQAALNEQRRLFERDAIGAIDLAATAADLGDKQMTLAYLKISVTRREPDNVGMGVSKNLEFLHGDPTFQALAREALPPSPALMREARMRTRLKQH